MNDSVLCVDIGGTSSKAGVLDTSGQLHFIDSIPTSPGAASFLDSLGDLVDRTLAKAKSTAFDISGIGVAVAGFVSAERDRLLYNANLSWLEGFPIKQRLAQRFDLPIELEVDSNAATMAEYHFGSGRKSKRFLCLTCGTGLGVGMTVDGIPLRFAYGCLGDIGHVIVQPDGPLCMCGGHGCAEILISAPVLAERYKLEIGAARDLSLRDVIEAAQQGEPRAIALLEETGRWLGLATASMANILFPDHIAVAGGLSVAGDLVLKPAERVFRESASIFARSNAGFSRATLGAMATLIGAAWPFWEDDSEYGESRAR
jgi:glucokinase